MIKGDKPSGYFVTRDENGNKIEGETRQCAHCLFTWIYQPGSGKKRGFCLSCRGLLCGRPVCIKMDCIPFRDALESGNGYKMTQEGVMVKKKDSKEKEAQLEAITKKFGNLPIIGQENGA